MTAAALAGLLSMAACSKMDAALGRQWMVVNFAPNTSMATALQVRTACSHIPHTPPLPMAAGRTVLNVLDGVAYNTTNSSTAEQVRLQACLGKFKSVVGVTPQDTGDEGS
jgi:hypothetical protein